MDKPTTMMEPSKTSGKGINKKKSRQQSKNKSTYRFQFDTTLRNKKRRLSRYIRRFPTDKQAQEIYEGLGYGSAKGHLANLLSHGKHLLKHLITEKLRRSIKVNRETV